MQSNYRIKWCSRSCSLHAFSVPLGHHHKLNISGHKRCSNSIIQHKAASFATHQMKRRVPESYILNRDGLVGPPLDKGRVIFVSPPTIHANCATKRIFPTSKRSPLKIVLLTPLTPIYEPLTLLNDVVAYLHTQARVILYHRESTTSIGIKTTDSLSLLSSLLLWMPQKTSHFFQDSPWMSDC
jgi:hypothetical protein